MSNRYLEKIAEEKFQPVHPSRKGLLHEEMGIPEGEHISEEQLRHVIATTDNPKTRQRAQFALNARGWKHAKKAGVESTIPPSIGAEATDAVPLASDKLRALATLKKEAAWGIYKKDSPGDIHSRTPGGMDADYKRLQSQMFELAGRKPKIEVNKELDSLHSSIQAKGIHNASSEELQKLITLRSAPKIDNVQLARRNNTQAWGNALKRGSTPHSQWYSGSNPSKFHFLESVNLEGLKKLKRLKK